jgi:hypothetical protein
MYLMVCTCPFTVRVSQLDVIDKGIADLLFDTLDECLSVHRR